MIEAYKIGISLALQNQVSSVLGLIARDFMKTDKAANDLRKTLKEIKLIGGIGIAIAGVGGIGIHMLDTAVGAAREYAHQLNIMNMAMNNHRDVSEAVALAWKTTGTVITTTATDNLKAILDLKNVLGDMGEATTALPIVQKIGAVMAASSESGIRGHAQEIAFSMAKALDIIGAVRDPAQFEKEASMMARVIVATQNRVSPALFQGVFNYARQAKFDLSDEFKYEILPTLMLESVTGSSSAGGGSRGVGPMLAALYRVTNQGYINKKSIALAKKLGYVDPKSAVRTTTQGTTTGAWTNASLWATSPFQASIDLEQRIKKAYPNATPEKVRQIVNELFRGNQLAAAMVVE